VRNIVVVTFTEPSKAYQALSTIKEDDAFGRLGLRTAAVVERQADGKPIVHDAAGVTDLAGAPDGTVGKLLEGLDGTADLAPIADRIPAGSTALMAEIEEYADEVIDVGMAHLGGTVYRESLDGVKAGLKAMKSAQREAEKQEKEREKEAHKLERERERAQRHNERVDSLERSTNSVEDWLEAQRVAVPEAPTTTPNAD
jgi:uncharacterized membrane protein